MFVYSTMMLCCGMGMHVKAITNAEINCLPAVPTSVLSYLRLFRCRQPPVHTKQLSLWYGDQYTSKAGLQEGTFQIMGLKGSSPVLIEINGKAPINFNERRIGAVSWKRKILYCIQSHLLRYKILI